MKAWEVTVMVAGIVSVGLFSAITVYLVMMLKKLSSVIEKLDHLVAQNTSQINSIVENVQSVTVDAKTMVGKLNNTVSSVGKAVSFARPQGAAEILPIKKVFEAGSFIYAAYRFLKDRKQRRQLNEVLKAVQKEKK